MSARKTILLIDDDPGIVHAMQTMLELKGYHVVTAADGAKGLAQAECNTPDLIIVDMMMPQKSGLVVLETLKSRKECCPRIIMITANEGSRHRRYAESLGVDDYLCKPFDLEDLLARVQRLCPPTAAPIEQPT